MIFFNFATDIPISTHRSVGNNVMESMRHKSNEILVNYFSLLLSKHKKKFLYLKFYFQRFDSEFFFNHFLFHKIEIFYERILKVRIEIKNK
jgi:hypothetical protein